MAVPTEFAEIVIVAISGRALAQSAAKTGVPVRVLDAFADVDTRAAAETACVGADGAIALDAARLIGVLEQLPATSRGRAIVTGSGFERQPQSLRRLTRFGRLCANEADVVAALKQPELAAELLRAIGWEVPPTQRTPPADPHGWLQKEIGGAGGVHIRRAGQPSRRGRTYYQRELLGQSMSVTFLADAERAYILGFNLQHVRAVGMAPWCYAGASTCSVPPPLAAKMQERLDRLVRVAGLRGLNGLDFLLDDDTVSVLEINPRPTATFELYDQDFPEGLVHWHIRSFAPAPLADFAGRLRGRRPPHRAYAIVYAARRLRVPDGVAFPDWCRDLPSAGSLIGPGAPVLSVYSSGESAALAQQQLRRREQQVRSLVARWMVESRDACTA